MKPDAFLDGYQKIAAITLDIEKGDILLGGRFKNIRQEVKDIGEDDLGQPTINGKKLLTVRIEKKMPEDRQSRETQEKTAAIDQQILRDAAKRSPEWRVSGLVQGALKDDPKKYNLGVEEEFKDDPWIASLGSTAPISDDQFRDLVSSYSVDPDGNGKPFYFVASRAGSEPVVIFQGNPNPMSINAAKKYGRQLGLPEEQLDFKHSLQKTAGASFSDYDTIPMSPGLYVVDRKLSHVNRFQQLIQKLKINPETKAQVQDVLKRMHIPHRMLVYVAPKGTVIRGKTGYAHGPYSVFTFSAAAKPGSSGLPKASLQDTDRAAETLIGTISSSYMQDARNMARPEFKRLNHLRNLPASDIIWGLSGKYIDKDMEEARLQLRDAAAKRKLAEYVTGKGLGIANKGIGLYQKLTGNPGAVVKGLINDPEDIKSISGKYFQRPVITPIHGRVTPNLLATAHDTVNSRIGDQPWTIPGSNKGYSCLDYGNSVLCNLGKKVPPTGKWTWRQVQPAKPGFMDNLLSGFQQGYKTLATPVKKSAEDLKKAFTSGPVNTNTQAAK